MISVRGFFMSKKQKNHKTEIDIIHEYLMSEGARELTKE